MATASASSLTDSDKVYAEEFNTASKYPRVKLFNFTYSLKRNPNIWWFIDQIKSENTHFTLDYYRIIGGLIDQKGFKERKRRQEEIQKDLDLTILKNRYLRNEFDASELNRRASF